MFRWYRELTSREQKTFWACFGGFGLDGMDVQIYSFVIPALISLWKLTPADAEVAGNLHFAVFSLWWMAHRNSSRPVWTRIAVADHYRFG